MWKLKQCISRGGSYLPEGNHARVHVYSIHHDARNFSRPETFWPERWLIAEGVQCSAVPPYAAAQGEMDREQLTHNPHAFLPFSFGPANCVGRGLAMAEMRAVVCAFVQRLDLSFSKGWDPLDWERDLVDMHVVKVGRLPVLIQQKIR